MKRTIFLTFAFMVFLGFTSCKTLSVDEFRQKYDVAEVEGEIVDVWYSAKFRFKYQNTTYEVLEPDPLYLALGEKYKILIDKNAPDKNYLVLRHKPVFKDTIPLAQFIINITDVGPVKNYIYIHYEILALGKRTKQTKSKEVFFEDIKYLDKIKKYEENNTDVIVDVFPINSSKVSFKINYKATEKL